MVTIPPIYSEIGIFIIELLFYHTIITLIWKIAVEKMALTWLEHFPSSMNFACVSNPLTFAQVKDTLIFQLQYLSDRKRTPKSQGNESHFG